MTQQLPLYTVDAFTDDIFGGNPAAVVLLENDDDISDEIKQKIATEMNLSETVYLSKVDKRLDFKSGNTFGIRWFTPVTEVVLCGHATVAASKVLFDVCSNVNSKVNYQTRASGVVSASLDKDTRICLDFPAHKPQKVTSNDYDSLVKAVIGDLPYSDLQICYPLKMLMIRLDDTVPRSTLESLKPDIQMMLRLDKYFVVVIVTLKGAPCSNGISDKLADNFDFSSRVFAPNMNVNEDPVCGSAHTVLGPYWSEVLGRKELNVLQCSPRVGHLLVNVRDDGRVDIAGKARVVIKGTITV